MLNPYVIINLGNWMLTPMGRSFKDTQVFAGLKKSSEHHLLSKAEPKTVIEIVNKGGIEFIKFDSKP